MCYNSCFLRAVQLSSSGSSPHFREGIYPHLGSIRLPQAPSSVDHYVGVTKAFAEALSAGLIESHKERKRYSLCCTHGSAVLQDVACCTHCQCCTSREEEIACCTNCQCCTSREEEIACCMHCQCCTSREEQIACCTHGPCCTTYCDFMCKHREAEQS